jgi:hypothetical protein
LVRWILAGVDPDGEELRVEVAFSCAVVVEHAAVEGVGEVPVLVDEALGSIGVGVDDDGFGVDFCSVGHLLSCGLFYDVGLGGCGRCNERQSGNEERGGAGEGASSFDCAHRYLAHGNSQIVASCPEESLLTLLHVFM